MRGKKGTVHVAGGTTIRELRLLVTEELQATPTKVDMGGRMKQLNGQEILMFKSENESAICLDEESLCENTDYDVFEKFSTVPVDLLRTVSLSQIHPMVKIGADNPPFSEVAPIFCAALSDQEAGYPPQDVGMAVSYLRQGWPPLPRSHRTEHAR